jgi:hypothetical protein
MPTALPRHSRRWLGFFVVLAALALVALVAPLIYNLSVQLRPEQLAAARQRWQANAPANYDLECLRKSRRGGQEEIISSRLQVRGGRIVLAAEEDELVYVDPSLALIAGCGLVLVADHPERYGMAALFDEIEAALRQRGTAEGRYYLKADFEKDGHPSHFVSYDARTKDRVEWFVKLAHVP